MNFILPDGDKNFSQHLSQLYGNVFEKARRQWSIFSHQVTGVIDHSWKPWAKWHTQLLLAVTRKSENYRKIAEFEALSWVEICQ